ncbi:hypothetical protein GCM10007921_27510 [Tritonibacter mobilis]|nr:hypothetical protein GCM10007921_27510 [Tritonibacter mobilis]
MSVRDCPCTTPVTISPGKVRGANKGPEAIPSPWCPKRSIVALVLAASVMRLHYRESGIGKSQKTRGSELLCGGAGVLLGSNEATRLPVPELRIKPVAL